ncbi:MarR family transcriptional regulator [Mesorhizobium sp.]|uniref:MarR family transcriptional regulator n=1 Tax=Mesorhizobium sp. TaxID=1871066 RepID=UPI0025F964BB|nr:MarR family transcriptional regulator [Mesorhizobium sp.]
MSKPSSQDDDDILHMFVRSFAQTETWKLAAQLIKSPRFTEALSSYCEVMTRPPEISWPVNKVFAQKLRYIVCFDLIGNYSRWRRRGAELPTLAALQRTAPASARQVASFVNALRLGGYVIAERGQDRRTLHLRPSSALLKEIARSPLAFLEASERIFPVPTSLVSRIGNNDELLADWLGRSVERFRSRDIYFAPFPTIVQFTEHDCGYPLLTAVMGANYASLSPGAPPALPLTYMALAERFRVSRQHIGNLFIGAKRRGWFSVVRGGKHVVVSQDLIREFEIWAAGQMAHYRIIAGEIAN